MKVSMDLFERLIFKPMDDYVARVKAWHRHFAILPVVIDNNLVFMQVVERRRVERTTIAGDGTLHKRVVTEYRHI